MNADPSLRKSPSRFVIAYRSFVLYSVALGATPAFASLGKGLVDYVKNYILAPLSIFAIAIAIGASIFRPEFVKTAIFVAIICAVLFFVLSNMDALSSALQSN